MTDQSWDSCDEREHLNLIDSVGVFAHAFRMWRDACAGLRAKLDAIRNELGCIADADVLPTIREYQANEEQHNDCLDALRRALGMGDDYDEHRVENEVVFHIRGRRELLDATGAKDVPTAVNLIANWRNRCREEGETDD